MEFIPILFNLMYRAASIYLYTFLICFTIYMPILLAYSCSRLGTKIHYLLWKLIIMYPVILLPGLFSPLFLLRPQSAMNARFTAWFLRKLSYIANVTWELRGANIAGMDQGAVVCCNHQSAVDIFAQLNVWKQFKLLAAIAKKEMFYYFPFGPGAWLCGLRYIDRSSSKKSYNTLSNVAKLMTKGKTKIWIYPEGTRNNKGGFLPFKKGAFFTAIEAQVPIIPVVIAPYYYMDEPKERFLFEKKHNIISVLDPIPTKGLTHDDVETLKDKTQSLMFKEYEKLKAEVTERSRNPQWVTKNRPRLTIVNRKFKRS